MRHLAIIILLALTQPYAAAQWFYGGPIHDDGRNSSLNSVRASQQNTLNILRSIDGTEGGKLSTVNAVSTILGQALAANFALPANSDDDKLEAELMDQMSQVRQQEGDQSMTTMALERQSASLKALRTFRDQVQAAVKTANKPLNFDQRMKLQNDMHVLNDQLFLMHYQRAAEDNAVRASAEQSKLQIRQTEQNIREITDRVGKE